MVKLFERVGQFRLLGGLAGLFASGSRPTRILEPQATPERGTLKSKQVISRQSVAIRLGLGLSVIGLLGACGPQSPKTAIAAGGAPASRATIADFAPSTQRSDMCSGANVVGVGLRGEYFAEPGWQGHVLLTRVDASVDFVNSLEWPEDQKDRLPGSARWTGWIKAPTSGRYRFHMTPTHARVTVSRVVAKGGEKTGPETGIDLVAGRFYPIVVEVDRPLAQALPIRLEWTAPHGARYVIPRAVLNLPTETVGASRTN